jgi:hypothetical protein
VDGHSQESRRTITILPASTTIPARRNFSTGTNGTPERTRENRSMKGPMINLLRDPFTLIAALTVVVLVVEIVAVHWL